MLSLPTQVMLRYFVHSIELTRPRDLTYLPKCFASTDTVLREMDLFAVKKEVRHRVKAMKQKMNQKSVTVTSLKKQTPE